MIDIILIFVALFVGGELFLEPDRSGWHGIVYQDTECSLGTYDGVTLTYECP